MLSDLAETDNKFVRRLLGLPGFSTLRQSRSLPVGGLTSRVSTPFTPTTRMRNGVHCLPTNMGANSEPSAATRFSPDNIISFAVSDLSDRCATIYMNFPYFPTRKKNVGLRALFGLKLRKIPSPPCQLSALPRHQFHIVDHHATRNIFQGHIVARLRFYFLSTENLSPNLDLIRGENVATFAIKVF